MADAALLEVSDIKTCYGLSQVLFGLSLVIAPGEVVTLMGRNGMGKTTTVRSVMGLTPALAGSIRFAGEEIRRLPSYRIAKLGIGLVPEGRQLFPISPRGRISWLPQSIGAMGKARGRLRRYARFFRASRNGC